ncbi:hypothetical protein [uncultured Rubinisphaera sp.]|uniref:hypothetical protein n=1 Tax=uncultured Rubinisphaera sp. TaxID=1678686 RepID=UPI0030DCF467|tara:strand:+ start:663 stop:1769 length:1107 start_codon:yes stop_codon:yes gene_type:complete
MNATETDVQDEYDPYSSWKILSKAFPNRDTLQEDSVYALPMPFIEAIERIAPKVLSEEDLGFERSLTQASGMGFFLRQPFWSPLLSDPGIEQAESIIDIEEQLQNTKQQISALLADEMKSAGRSDLSIENYRKELQQIEQDCQVRQKGFAGWLITSPEFQTDRTRFWDTWKDVIQQKAEMPSFPKTKMAADTPLFSEERRQRDDYLLFFKKWGLESLSTSHLPLPMNVNPFKTSWYDKSHLIDAGVLFFAPWYLLGDKNLKLDDVIRHQAAPGHLQHLTPWIDRNSSENKTWGHERFATMLELYVYLILGLFKRYPERIRRNKARIDEAFTEFTHGQSLSALERGIKSESIRKIRQELESRLKQAQQL